jgi:hypothetical protein
MAGAPSSSGIEITPHFFLSFLLFLWQPRYLVDGQEVRGRWEQPTLIPVAPGTHHVRITYPYYWIISASPAELDVDVPAGTTRRVGYRARWLIWLKGKTTVQ